MRCDTKAAKQDEWCERVGRSSKSKGTPGAPRNERKSKEKNT